MQNNKRYWLRGGVTGILIGILISIYFANQSFCIGSYLDHVDKNGVPVMGTVCPDINILTNLQNSIIPNLVMIVILFLIGMFVGYLYGKIRNRNRNR